MDGRQACCTQTLTPIRNARGAFNLVDNKDTASFVFYQEGSG